MTKILIWLLSIVSISIVWGQEGKPGASPCYKIRGMVVDDNNKPLENATVRLYALGNFSGISQLCAYKTGRDGKYELDFSAGIPLMIIYDCKEMHPTIVTNISGTQDQYLDKVMHRVGMAYARDELLEILSAYERIYFIDIAGHNPPDKALLERHQCSLGMTKYIDDLTERRYREVVAMYGR